MNSAAGSKINYRFLILNFIMSIGNFYLLKFYKMMSSKIRSKYKIVKLKIGRGGE